MIQSLSSTSAGSNCCDNSPKWIDCSFFPNWLDLRTCKVIPFYLLSRSNLFFNRCITPKVLGAFLGFPQPLPSQGISCTNQLAGFTPRSIAPSQHSSVGVIFLILILRFSIHSIRSDPVPTPAPRPSPHSDNPDIGCSSISIEAGSG